MLKEVSSADYPRARGTVLTAKSWLTEARCGC
ncbi:Uncharacterised protein [Salmonella enterica subsp. enterica serovar Madelia]|nr:Uncharacterised protein [Salmonella enterica subsp. enterica serovar Madelia]